MSDVNENEKLTDSKRAIDFGFFPEADAANNVKALQKALDKGGLVVVDVPGVYEVNDTIFISSNTHLLCERGVILKKVAPYCNVLLNRGAIAKEYDENITVEGLEISVNGFEAEPKLVYGLRAQVGFYYVRNLTIRNFRCVDGKEYQYLMYFVTWENLHLDGVTLAGAKDGIKLNNGHDALLENIELRTYDDGLSMCGTDYATTLVEAGDVYNVTCRNITDYQYENIFGRTCLIYTGSWADYADGNEYMIGDLCLNDGRLYQCVNEPGVILVGRSAPTHCRGIVVGDDGIAWRYVQECNFYHTDVYNISFDSCIFEKSGNVITSWIERGRNHRNYYPGTEHLSNSWNISVSNCRVNANGEQVFLCVNGNMKNAVISNCVLKDMEAVVRVNSSISNDEFDISIIGCHFVDCNCPLIAVHSACRVPDWAAPFVKPDSPGYLYREGDWPNICSEAEKRANPITVNCRFVDNKLTNSSFENIVLDGAKLKMINLDE